MNKKEKFLIPYINKFLIILCSIHDINCHGDSANFPFISQITYNILPAQRHAATVTCCRNDRTLRIANYATICISACREAREFRFGRWIFGDYHETQVPTYLLENLTDLPRGMFTGACCFSRLQPRLLSLTAWIRRPR